MMALKLQIFYFRSFLEHENIDVTDGVLQELERLRSY